MDNLFTHYNSTTFLFLNDFLLGPIYIYILIILAKKYAKKKGGGYELYFVKAMVVRIIGCVLTAFMYQYYYHGGDTFVYFLYILKIKEVFYIDFDAFIDLAFKFKHNPFIVAYYTGNESYYFFDSGPDLVIKIGLYLSYFFLNTFILISLTITMFAFLGCWKLFKMFTELYPHLEKEIAIATLFIPSVFYWGTGLMKDPICIGALGLFTYSIYEAFIKRKKIIINIIIAIINGFLIVKIKVYIILAFAPASALWIFSRYRYTIKNDLLRALMGPIMYLAGGAISILILSLMASFAERYSINEMMRTAKDTQNWLVTSSKVSGGSFYTLGDIDYTLLGILKVFPKAINVALFRPYIWEARKIMLFPAAIEGIFTMFITVRLLFRTGFFRFIKMVGANAEVQFCLIFSIIFAFAVGFTSFNFGALARYKIPFMPFYYIAIFILSDTQKKDEILVKKNKK